MGLGPSIKMTTLHHYNCPITKQLISDLEVEYVGIIAEGVSESYQDKLRSAIRTAELVQALRADGALVAIDGWGNHHIDFVSVIEQLGLRNIPSVGLSYIGQQGRLVCTNTYVDTVIDFNKSVTGYESCVVGQNNLTELDAFKAIAILKNKIKQNPFVDVTQRTPDKIIRSLHRRYINLSDVRFGKDTQIINKELIVRKDIGLENAYSSQYIKEVKVSIYEPGKQDVYVNSNLDFQPIVCKQNGGIGEGVSVQLNGITCMLTGVEDISGYQPANIGSSEGYLKEQVVFDQAGTPKKDDYLLHVDCLFANGQARTAEGIQAAHQIMDSISDEIRYAVRKCNDYDNEDVYNDTVRSGKPRVVLIKLLSGLGTMYDTSLFGQEPAGYMGSILLREMSNMPVFISPAQCLDGAIHSLV